MRAAVFGALVSAAAAQGPVKKVVTLLRDMKTETEANQKTDKELYDKLMCWCKKTAEETTKGLEDAADCIKNEQTNAETGAGTHAEKKTQADNLETDIAQAEKELEKAIAQREKEANEFGEQEKDLIQSIGALKSAITVLSKHNKGFLQESTTSEIRDKYGRFIAKYQDKLSPSQRNVMQQFLQQPSSGAYSSQSGEIFGILESMLDEMQADLSDAGAEEAASQEAFATMKANKTQTIKDKTKLMQECRAQAGQAGEDAENAKEALAACQAEQEKLEAMKANAEQQCEAGKEEFQARSKAIAEEIKAIDKAIEILDSEKAFAAFAKTTDATLFLQRSLKKLALAKNTSKVLAMLHKSAGDDFFSNFGFGKSMHAVAMMLQQKGLDGQQETFQKILNAVDEQIKAKKDLLAAKTAEKDECVNNINQSEKNLAKINNAIEKAEAEILRLETAISELEDKIKSDKEKIESITTSTKEISQERSEANAQYMKEMEENKAAVQLIEQAKAVLAEVYAKSFMQTSQAPQFDRYEQNAGGNKVIAMMDTIINDTKSEMKVAMTAENAAQKAYETQVKDNNDAVKATKESLAKAEKTKADKEGSLAEENSNLKNKNNELDAETTNNEQLHKNCDFLLDNFKAITDAHQEEVDGLTEAKTILGNVIADLK